MFNREHKVKLRSILFHNNDLGTFHNSKNICAWHNNTADIRADNISKTMSSSIVTKTLHGKTLNIINSY